MPPPPPDRRDYLYKEGRRHDRGGGGDPLPPPLRDHARPSPRRAPSSTSEGYYRQGGAAYDRFYPDEPPLGYTPSRSDRYWVEDDGSGGYKGLGRRDGRDMRGSYRRSPCRGYGGDFSKNHQEQPPPPPPRRSPLRSVAVPICYDPPDSRYHSPPPLRDHARPSPRRAPSSTSEGYYRQGGGPYDRSYPDELPLGYTPSRSDRYWVEDDGGGGCKGLGRRDGRDMRGSYRRSPFKDYGGDFSRNHQEQPPPPPPRRSPLRSVAVPICYDPPGNRIDKGDRENLPRVTPWRRRENRSEVADAAGARPLSAGQATRPAASEKASAQAAAVAAAHGAEEEAPRKKARLGWGQGLAKYEKQKVHVPADSVEAVADGSPVDAELRTASPAAAPVLCASPVAAPSPQHQPPPPPPPPPLPLPPPPAYCSSAPEDKSCELMANISMNPTKDAPEADDQACKKEFSTMLGQLGDDPIESLASMLSELLQHDDSCSGDSKGLTSTAKLLLLKESISKEIEKTELEIDSFECELKSVNSEAGTTLEASPTGVTYAENLSPSIGTSKAHGSAEISEMSHVKELGEVIPSHKEPVVQDTEVKGAEMMEIETAPVHNIKAVSSEESAASPRVMEGQACVAADVGLLKAPAGDERQNYVKNERLETSACRVDADSVKAESDCAIPSMQCSYHDHKYNLVGLITSSNNDFAKESNECVFKLLPSNAPHLDLSTSRFLSQRENDLVIKDRIGVHKNSLRFKEQILTFKFRAYRHLWKEDMRLLSAKKQRSKSNKRIDQSNRTSQAGSQRQRSSNRSRLAMPAGNLSTFSTPEMSDVASKLFSEFQIKRSRNYLKMPALIIDEKEKECLSFVSKNGLVEDPLSVEKERIVINPWTQEEKEIFMEMLAKFGKDFSKISSFLTHKTTADCVEFYYKHHKSDSFREVKKLLDLRQQQQPTSNYLGAKSGKKWNPEANAASLDILGVASGVAHDLEYKNGLEKFSAKSLIRTAFGPNVPFVAKKSFDSVCVDNVPLHERESVAADVLAGICGTLSPGGMGSCITSSADLGQKIGITRMEPVLTPEFDKSIDEEDTLSDQECEVDPVDWNDDEKSIFVKAMNNYGKDFARISSCVKSKSYEQCKVFFSKAQKSLGLDLIHQGAVDVSMPTSDNNGGRSDNTDEACAAEMDSAPCSTQSPLKVEMDVCPTERAFQEPNSGTISKLPEIDGSNECDIVDVKVEEGEDKADKNCSLADHNQLSEATPHATCGFIDINCPESTDKLQSTDNVIDQVRKHKNSAVSSSTEQAMSVQSEIRSTSHSVEVFQAKEASQRIDADVFQKEGCSHNALDNAPTKAGNSGAPACSTADSGTKDNVVRFSNMTAVPAIGPQSNTSFQHPTAGDVPPLKPKPHVTPLTPKDLMPVQFSSVLSDPTSICFEGIASITTPNFEDIGNKHTNAFGTKVMNKYPAFEDQSGNQHDTLLRNIDGYMNRHLTTELPFFSERTASCTASTSQTDQFTLTKIQNGRSSSLGLPNAADGIQWAKKHEGVPESVLRPCSRNTSSGGGDDQPKRPGDVKLFGQILSHQSSLQGSGSSCNGNKSKPPSPKIEISSVRLLNNPRDRGVCSSRPTISAYSGLDGSTTQPEPLLVMAKCQRSLAGVPFYSAKTGALGVFSDHQQPLMQSHQSDPKRLERFADPQKRNGMEFISGFQQPGKVSRFGGAGILVSGVSDPVAALKVQYGPGSKIMSSDVDPWKDIGSR